jgi:hypothetical protein
MRSTRPHLWCDHGFIWSSTTAVGCCACALLIEHGHDPVSRPFKATPVAAPRHVALLLALFPLVIYVTNVTFISVI